MVKKERKAYKKMVGQSEGRYQREGIIGGGNVRPCYTEAHVILHRPPNKSGNKIKRKKKWKH